MFVDEIANPLTAISLTIEFLEAQLKPDEASPYLYLLLEMLGNEIRRFSTRLNGRP